MVELIYVWIKKYKGLENLDVNLGSEYYFNKKETELHVKRNELYLQDLYGEYVQNITGVIGENGSGKTSVIKYIAMIMNYLTHPKNRFERFKNENILLVFKEENSVKCITSFEGVKIVKADGCYVDEKIITGVDDIKNTVKDISLAYYSNNIDIDLPVEIANNPHCIDLSFRSTLDSYLDGVRDSGKLDKLFSERFANNKFEVQSTAKLINKDVFSIIKFLSNAERLSDLEYKKPRNLYLTLDFQYFHLKGSGGSLGIDDTNIMFDNNKPFIQEAGNIFSGIIAWIDDKANNENLSEFFVAEVMRRLIDNFLIDFQRNFNMPFYIGASSDNQEEFEILELVKELFRIDDIDDNKDNYKKIIEYCNSYYESMVKIYELLESLSGVFHFSSQEYSCTVKKSEKEWSHNLNTTSLCRVELKDEESYKNVVKIYEVFDALPSKNEFLLLEFDGLSTGEYEKLSMYTKLYQNFSELENDNILMLIDEGEAYYHPEWKRKYVSDLISFFGNKKIYKNVQYILSSNSPYIVSDLPKYNLLFLENLKLKRDSEEIVSFGANIHNLLLHSFFMKDTKGEFVKRALKELVNEIETGDLRSPYTQKNIERKINNIGEPYLSHEMQKLYSKKLEHIETVDDIDVQIDKLIRRKEKILARGV